MANTLSLHDALPIFGIFRLADRFGPLLCDRRRIRLDTVYKFVSHGTRLPPTINYNDYYFFFKYGFQFISKIRNKKRFSIVYTLFKIKKIKEVTVKRLYKSRKNKVIDGVCGGIAEYFEVDPVLVRVLFVLFLFMGGSAFIAYIVGMIIIPKEPQDLRQKQEKAKEETQPVSTQSPTDSGALIIGIFLVVLGAFFIMGNFHMFGGFYWWMRHHFWDYMIPGLIIVAGLALIIKGAEK
jgi:phage shock protein C